MMQKTLFFDIGNVQLYFDHHKMVRAIAQLLALPEETIRDLFFKKNLLIEWELGKITGQYLYHFLSQMSEKKCSCTAFFEALSNIFQPNTSLFPLIQRLKSEGCYLILLSNIGDVHFDYISSHYPLLSSFDDRILSFEVNLRKPHPQIYREALRRSKGPSLYIDDVEEFVLAAKKENLDSYLFQTTDQLKQQLILKRFLNEKV